MLQEIYLDSDSVAQCLNSHPPKVNRIFSAWKQWFRSSEIFQRWNKVIPRKIFFSPNSKSSLMEALSHFPYFRWYWQINHNPFGFSEPRQIPNGVLIGLYRNEEKWDSPQSHPKRE